MIPPKVNFAVPAVGDKYMATSYVHGAPAIAEITSINYALKDSTNPGKGHEVTSVMLSVNGSAYCCGWNENGPSPYFGLQPIDINARLISPNEIKVGDTYVVYNKGPKITKPRIQLVTITNREGGYIYRRFICLDLFPHGPVHDVINEKDVQRYLNTDEWYRANAPRFNINSYKPNTIYRTFSKDGNSTLIQTRDNPSSGFVLAGMFGDSVTIEHRHLQFKTPNYYDFVFELGEFDWNWGKPNNPGTGLTDVNVITHFNELEVGGIYTFDARSNWDRIPVGSRISTGSTVKMRCVEVNKKKKTFTLQDEWKGSWTHKIHFALLNGKGIMLRKATRDEDFPKSSGFGAVFFSYEGKVYKSYGGTITVVSPCGFYLPPTIPNNSIYYNNEAFKNFQKKL